MVPVERDAYGQELLAYLKGENKYEIVERDDGLIAASEMIKMYFAPFEAWPVAQQKGMEFVTGRSLDIGCGAGRVCIHVQKLGGEIVGIDNSPGAIQVCKLRGVADARLVPITKISRRLGKFDTLIMLGNNFGLFGNPTRAKWLLRKFHGITRAGARIIAESRDPYQTKDPLNLAYHAKNQERGRMSGQLRLRVRYRTTVGPWFDYLLVSPSEMSEILRGTGWEIKELFPGEMSNLAVLSKSDDR